MNNSIQIKKHSNAENGRKRTAEEAHSRWNKTRYIGVTVNLDEGTACAFSDPDVPQGSLARVRKIALEAYQPLIAEVALRQKARAAGYVR